jgi:ABC-type cobalamin/Fe3+-siderophores transport system ATPase subunit
MLELLGVGIARRDGTWLVRGVSARIDTPGVIVVTGGDVDARRGVLDAIACHVVPTEGRVWVSGIPVGPTTRTRVQSLIRDVDPAFTLLGQRTVLTHVASTGRRWASLLPASRQHDLARAEVALERVGLRAFASDSLSKLAPASRVMAEVARALAKRSEFLLIREIDASIDPLTLETMAHLLRGIASRDRLTIVVTAREPGPLRKVSDATLALAPQRAAVTVA